MEFWSTAVLMLLIILNPQLRPIFFRPVPSEKPLATDSGRLEFFDHLRGIAIIAVIFIHLPLLYERHFGSTQTEFFDFFNNLVRFAIPFFFIASGVLLKPIFDETQTFGNYLRRKVLRIVVPYTLCVAAIVAFHRPLILDSFHWYLSGIAATPYYFVVLIFQFYLIYPLLIRLRKYSWFLHLMLLISFVAYVTPWMWKWNEVPLFPRYLFFFAYGVYVRDYILGREDFSAEKVRWLAVVLIYALLSAFALDRFTNHRYFYGVALFNLCYIYAEPIAKSKYLARVLQAFGKRSLWIFLTHFLVCEILVIWSASLSGNFPVHMLYLTFAAVISSYAVAVAFEELYERVLGRWL